MFCQFCQKIFPSHNAIVHQIAMGSLESMQATYKTPNNDDVMIQKMYALLAIYEGNPLGSLRVGLKSCWTTRRVAAELRRRDVHVTCIASQPKISHDPTTC